MKRLLIFSFLIFPSFTYSCQEPISGKISQEELEEFTSLKAKNERALNDIRNRGLKKYQNAIMSAPQVSQENRERLADAIRNGTVYEPKEEDNNRGILERYWDKHGFNLPSTILGCSEKLEQKAAEIVQDDSYILPHITIPACQMYHHGDEEIEESETKYLIEKTVAQQCPNKLKSPFWYAFWPKAISEHPYYTGRPILTEMSENHKRNYPHDVVYASPMALHVNTERLATLPKIIQEEYIGTACQDFNNKGPVKRKIIPYLGVTAGAYAGTHALGKLFYSLPRNKKGPVVVGGAIVAAAYKQAEDSDLLGPVTDTIKQVCYEKIMGCIPGTKEMRQSSHSIEKCMKAAVAQSENPKKMATDLAQYYQDRIKAKPLIAYSPDKDDLNNQFLPEELQGKGPTNDYGYPNDRQKVICYTQLTKNRQYRPRSLRLLNAQYHMKRHLSPQ